jgi:hypothetical protein
MTNEERAFGHLDFTLDEAAEADAQLLAGGNRRGRDPRVCICGHPVSRHTTLSGGLVYCKPSRMECPCKTVRPVIEASDTRLFLRKTEGPGVLHALGRGVQVSVKAGHEITWLVPMQCDRCKTEGQVSPVPVTQRGVAVNEPTGFDALLCRKCREEV